MTRGTRRVRRSGTRRLGDDYQDLVALEILVDWLEHHDRYSWVRVEADDTGSLDDVTALRSDHRLQLWQVKFSVHPDDPDDPWTWDVLLEQSRGRRGHNQSLLQKWATSLDIAMQKYTLHEAAVISNRSAGDDLREALTLNGQVEFDRIEATIQQRIIGQLGDEAAARRFFDQFYFRLNQPNLSEREDGLRRRFTRQGGTDYGWLRLREAVRAWVAFHDAPSQNGHITLADIHHAAEWHPLRSLPQDLEIPTDYVLPSQAVHAVVLTKLQRMSAGCVVIQASPGAGKSTYISWLYQELLRSGIPVIRHHYFLAVNDRLHDRRLDHLRVIESLLHDLLRDHAEELGDCATENPVPDPDRLARWLEACGQSYATRDKVLVVLIDGLDHVWRERRSIEELERLLGVLFPVPEGIIVVVATQPIDDAQMPLSLLRAAPRDHWLQLPFLDHEAVENWLRYHEPELAGSEDELPDHIWSALISRIYHVTGGHPLILRYLLGDLRRLTLPLTPGALEQIGEELYPDVMSYYQSLWHSLSNNSRDILHLLAACPFPWPRDGVLMCLAPDQQTTRQVTQALRQVEHLLRHDAMGLRPFHSSLLVFVTGLPEHADVAVIIKRQALQWLKTFAPVYWRWAFTWLLEADLGDDQSLRQGVTRQWAIEAIRQRQTHQDIQTILTRSITASLVCGDLTNALRVGLLGEYCFYYNTFEFRSDTFEILLYPQLRLTEDPTLPLRLQSIADELTNRELAIMAEHAANHNELHVVERYLEILRYRVQYNRSVNATDVSKRWDTNVSPFLQVAALLSTRTVNDIVRIAVRNRPQGYTLQILKIYAHQLWVRKDAAGLRALVANTIPGPPTPPDDPPIVLQHERAIPLHTLIQLALEEELRVDDILTEHDNNDPWVAIYRCLNQLPNAYPGIVPSYDLSVLSVNRQERNEHDLNTASAFVESFICCLANYLSGLGDRHHAWLEEIGSFSWPRAWVQHLATVAHEIAEMVTAGQAPTLGWLFSRLADHPRPSWPSVTDDVILGYGNAAAEAAVRIASVLIAVRGAVGLEIPITQADLAAMFASRYVYPDNWVEKSTTWRRQWMEPTAVDWLVQQQNDCLATTIEPFPERAAHFAHLAGLAALYDRADLARSAIEQAASNLIAHGNHKDMLLDQSLTVVRWYAECVAQGNIADSMERPRRWLMQLAPAIAAITDYTDGDHTGHVPRNLANALAEIAPDLLPVYHQWLFEQEDSYNALHAFHVFLEHADLADPLDQAIASTAIDDESLQMLAQQVEQGDIGAAELLNRIATLLGPGAHHRQPEHEESPSTPFEHRPENPPLVSDFEPQRFGAYLAELHTRQIIDRETQLRSWMAYWVGKGHAAEVVQVLTTMLAEGSHLRIADEVFELVRSTYGREPAYPWLVRAHIDGFGWTWYYTRKEDTMRRWDYIRRLYPDRWYDFLRETLGETVQRYASIGHDLFARITEYCLIMGQPALAPEIIDVLVSGALELVSPVTLPTPSWTDQDDTP